VIRWNVASQAILLIYPPDGVAQGLKGELKMGKFKKPDAEEPKKADVKPKISEPKKEKPKK